MKVVKLSSQDLASLKAVSKNGVTRFVYRKSLAAYVEPVCVLTSVYSRVWGGLRIPRQAVSCCCKAIGSHRLYDSQ